MVRVDMNIRNPLEAFALSTPAVYLGTYPFPTKAQVRIAGPPRKTFLSDSLEINDSLR